MEQHANRQPVASWPVSGWGRVGTILAAFLFAVAPATKAQLVINELMQSNVDCVLDDLNDFPDSWVELYNAGSDTVSLDDYRICIKPAAATAWRLPWQKVAPGDHVLVCCDKVGSGLHTDFRLESGKGCQLFLLRGEEAVDWVTDLPKQPAPNTAYGRSSDGGDEWGYQLTPTPGKPNGGGLATGTLGTPCFTPTGRILTTDTLFSLCLSVPDASPSGTVIRYTTDGTEPTERSAAYSSPLCVGSNTIVRARLFCEGYLSPPSTCQSYIFFPSDRQLTMPVVSITTDSCYLYDPKIGIYASGNYQEGKPNYKFNWRRPVNIELFETTDVPSSLNQLCETRVFGGSSRDNFPRSLSVYAHKRFGEKRFDYEFFPDDRPGISDYKSFALRNAGNDYHDLYMRDAVIQRAMARHCDLDWQAWRPAIVFVNGSYLGMLNIRDRSNEDNVYTYHDGLEDIDLVSNFGILEEGSLDNFNAFRTFYSEEGHTMAEYEQWMDCQEFINLMAMSIFHANWDFPGNNSIMWRPRTEGGRWRFIAKDLDSGLGLYGFSPEYDYVEWLYDIGYDSIYNWGNSPAKTLLFRQLMADSTFRRSFIDHAAVYMGDFLSERGIRPVWDDMVDRIRIELPFHRSQNHGRPWSMYEDELARARSWLSRRAANVYQHLARRYDLGQPVPLTVSSPVLSAQADHPSSPTVNPSSLSINGIPVRLGSFDGMFFAGHEVTVEATVTDDLVVKGWTVTTVTDSLVTTTTLDANANEYGASSSACGDDHSFSYTFTMPRCDSLALQPVIVSTDGIVSVLSDGVGAKSVTARNADAGAGPVTARNAIYSLQGVRRSYLQKGLNIVGGKKIQVR